FLSVELTHQPLEIFFGKKRIDGDGHRFGYLFEQPQMERAALPEFSKLYHRDDFLIEQRGYENDSSRAVAADRRFYLEIIIRDRVDHLELSVRGRLTGKSFPYPKRRRQGPGRPKTILNLECVLLEHIEGAYLRLAERG